MWHNVMLEIILICWILGRKSGVGCIASKRMVCVFLAVTSKTVLDIGKEALLLFVLNRSPVGPNKFLFWRKNQGLYCAAGPWTVTRGHPSSADSVHSSSCFSHRANWTWADDHASHFVCFLKETRHMILWRGDLLAHFVTYLTVAWYRCARVTCVSKLSSVPASLPLASTSSVAGQLTCKWVTTWLYIKARYLTHTENVSLYNNQPVEGHQLATVKC